MMINALITSVRVQNWNGILMLSMSVELADDSGGRFINIPLSSEAFDSLSRVVDSVTDLLELPGRVIRVTLDDFSEVDYIYDSMNKEINMRVSVDPIFDPVL